MKMYQLVKWFQLNFPQLHTDLLQCNHNFDEHSLNPYHFESDCWSHTMMVCKIAEISGYDKEVLIAALLHDIGKPAARKVNPKNNHVSFYGHEELSVQLAENILSKMMKEEIIDMSEALEIKELIVLHSFLHKNTDPHLIFSKFQHKKQLYVHMVELNRCDNLGRFCSDNDSSDKHYQMLISYSKNMEDAKDHEISITSRLANILENNPVLA